MATKLPDIKKVVQKLVIVINKQNGHNNNEQKQAQEKPEVKENEKAKEG